MYVSFPSPVGILPKTLVVVKHNGQIFYNAKQGQKFNLPGNLLYEIIGNYSVTSPIKYDTLPGVSNVDHGRIKQIILCNNPHTASIDIKEGCVYFDHNKYYAYDVVKRSFILYHEIGHFKYKDEKKCDKYANNMLLLEGFNPSQIAKCHQLLPNDRKLICSEDFSYFKQN